MIMTNPTEQEALGLSFHSGSLLASLGGCWAVLVVIRSRYEQWWGLHQLVMNISGEEE
jgi:hypothetical protein